MSFLTKLTSGEFGELRRKGAPVYTPLSDVEYRRRFSDTALEMASRMERQVPPSRMGWYKVDHMRRYFVTLRSGIVPIEFEDGKSETECADAAAAVMFLREAAQAALDGELDALLGQARRKKSAAKLR